MRAPLRYLSVIVLVASVGVGCSSSDERAPGLGNCEGQGCVVPIGTGNTPGQDAGDSDVETDGATGDTGLDAAKTTTLAGQVVLLSDERFAEPFPMVGGGFVRVPTPDGDEILSYGVDGGPGYQSDKVLVGPSWFSVFPDDSVADAGFAVYPTWSLLTVPENGSNTFDIPVLNRPMFNTIYGAFDNPTFPRVDSAQIVLVFEKLGQRVAGVSLTDYPSSEVVAYDISVGYSTTATATGGNGVALLVNTQGAGKVTWKGTGSTGGSFTLIHVPGQASFARIEVD